jgi:hypothetical protein
MDFFDVIALIFFGVIPIALIVCIVRLSYYRRTVKALRTELVQAQERVMQMQAAQGAKNTNHSNRI